LHKYGNYGAVQDRFWQFCFCRVLLMYEMSSCDISDLVRVHVRSNSVARRGRGWKRLDANVYSLLSYVLNVANSEHCKISL
jgi:hypothetical protein